MSMRKLKQSFHNYAWEVSNDCIVKGNFTCVKLQCFFNGITYTGYGFSKRNPRDEYNLALGVTKARGRAYQDCVRQWLAEQQT